MSSPGIACMRDSQGSPILDHEERVYKRSSSPIHSFLLSQTEHDGTVAWPRPESIPHILINASAPIMLAAGLMQWQGGQLDIMALARNR